MRKKSLLIILSIISISLFAQNNSNFNGLSISTGNIHPDGPNFGVALQKQLIHVNEFDTLMKCDVIYELKIPLLLLHCEYSYAFKYLFQRI